MKTSNIILSIITGSITLLLITGMVQNRYFVAENKGGQEINLESNAVDLPAFRYLVIQNQSNVELKSSVENKLVVRYGKGEAVPEVPYHVSNDTLYVGNTNGTIQNDAYTQLLIPAMPVGWIKGLNAHFRFYGFYSDRLNIILDRSTVDLNSGDGQGLRELTVLGSNDSRVNSNTFHIDSLTIQLENSKAYTPLTTDNLTGWVKDHSELNIKDVGHFDFTRDETSKLSHWN